MIFRSASSPILSSLLSAAAKDPSPDHAAAELSLHFPQIARNNRSVSLPSPSLSSSPSPRKTMTRVLSESDLSDLSAAPPKRGSHLPSRGFPPPVPLKESGIEEVDEEREKAPDSSSTSLSRLLSSSGLDGLVDRVDGCCVAEGKDGGSAATLVFGGGCVDGGGRICGGRSGGGGGAGGGGGGGGEFGFSDSNKGSDAYYLKMIEASPGNSLVLGNYAKFLKEVRNDLVKAQEYCERAILVNPGDADALTLYADLIWQTSKDVKRAEGYFDRAVQSAPQDCYVMASYARFLWDAEEEEEEGDYAGEEESINFVPPSLFQGATAPSIAAAS